MNILCRNICGVSGSHPNISRLHPSIRAKATQLVQAIEAAGISVYIPDSGTYRTFAEQNALYAIGRTTQLSRSTVTNAKGGQSWHNYGLAVDIVPVNGGYKAPYSTYKKMGDIAKSLGWEWGGDWNSFKDLVHFENHLGYTRNDLYNMHQSGKVDANDYVLIGQSTSNATTPPPSSSNTGVYIALAVFAAAAVLTLSSQPKPLPYRYPPQQILYA